MSEENARRPKSPDEIGMLLSNALIQAEAQAQDQWKPMRVVPTYRGGSIDGFVVVTDTELSASTTLYFSVFGRVNEPTRIAMHYNWPAIVTREQEACTYDDTGRPTGQRLKVEFVHE